MGIYAMTYEQYKILFVLGICLCSATAGIAAFIYVRFQIRRILKELSGENRKIAVQEMKQHEEESREKPEDIQSIEKGNGDETIVLLQHEKQSEGRRCNDYDYSENKSGYNDYL